MNIELFAASVLCSASFSLMAYLALAKKIKRPSGSNHFDHFDIASIESKFSDLVSELNHAANSHVNAVEDRRDELKRIITSANDRVRKLASLLSDLEIIEKRIRGSIAQERETIVEDLAPGKFRHDLYRQIRSQADAGVAPAVIAAGLHVPMNEVEMVLRRKV